jgi:hypothetical protein
MPPLDKPMDKLLRPSLEREYMIAPVLSQKKLNTEDKTTRSKGTSPPKIGVGLANACIDMTTFSTNG